MTQEVKDKYFNMLSEEEIWQLYTMYQMDFQMFGYLLEQKYLIRYKNNHWLHIKQEENLNHLQFSYNSHTFS